MSPCGGQVIIFREDNFKMSQDFILLNEQIKIKIMVSFILFFNSFMMEVFTLQINGLISI